MLVGGRSEIITSMTGRGQVRIRVPLMSQPLNGHAGVHTPLPWEKQRWIK